MIQGTASSVGKSLITAGLCRIFRQDGLKVVPFKSQNMALNSFITADGLEMGRAQVVQAEAAGVEPDVRMNPILLKPTTDKKAQVIINGKVYGNMSATEYHNFKPRLKDMIKKTYDQLASENDIIVIEGAGSPAEINLRDRDIVNMGMAELADAPVLLVGDIDKGGVFASLAGTMLLLPEEEKRRVKGVIINKFRGDLEILKPGIKMIEDIIRVPVIGVIPYAKLAIDDEDSVSEKLSVKRQEGICEIDIAVIRLPHISNFTDFNALDNVSGVMVRYVEDVAGLNCPDMVILPGTKNTMGDMLYLRDSGLEKAIILLNVNGIPVFGICGGYQMLGAEIYDPYNVESGLEKVAGIGLLDAVTVMQKEKRTLQVEAEICDDPGILEGTQGLKVKGYEIHMGITTPGSGCRPFSMICRNGNPALGQPDGACDKEGKVVGTYIHGIFDNSEFMMRIINNLRRKKGLHELDRQGLDHNAFKQMEYDRLAQLIREHVDMTKVYEIMNNWKEGTV
ncbi:MAG: cobyric acid synthase [Firmicutes bacterium]|nr:cobyric acid synthase [Bacillota bacterium]